jgi:glucose-6-phosphate 1-epimerase
MQTVEQLSEQYGIANVIWFEDMVDGYPVVRICNQHAEASIALHGAHLIDYRRSGEAPVIFTSSDAIYRKGKAIRGGIPVCWPWFGANDGKPSHGFARTSFWTLQKTEHDGEDTRLIFALPTREDCPLSAKLEFSIGKMLQLTLTTTNEGDVLQTFSEALHSYFMVGDSRHTHIQGLDGSTYMDEVGETTARIQEGPVTFPREVDRIYHSDATVVIEDMAGQRHMEVSKTGGRDTVVWNPGLEKGSAMADLLDAEIHSFVCAESANVDGITINPGGNHILALTISLR